MSSMSKQSLSDLWRTAKSTDPGIELASILDGCRVIAQSIIPKSEVVFAGVNTAKTDMKTIFISPLDMAKNGTFPVPGDKVDIALGQTVHEVGHIMFSPDKAALFESVARSVGLGYHYGGVNPQKRKLLTHIINVVEDIYVDHLMSLYPGYREYLSRERDAALGEFDVNDIINPLQSDECDRTDILNAIIYITLSGGQIPAGITTENMQRLGEIMDLTMKICTKKMPKEKALVKIWEVFQTIPEKVEHTPPQPPPAATNQDENSPESEPQQDKELDKSPETGDKEDNEKPEETDKIDGKSDESPEEKPEDETGNDTETTDSEDGDDKEDDEDDDDGSDQTDRKSPEPSEELSEDEQPDGTTDIKETPDDKKETEPEPQKQWEQPDLADKLDKVVNDTSQLSPELAADVADVMSGKNEDLTQSISYLAKNSQNTIVAYTPEEDGVIVANARGTTAMVEEKLRRILQDFRLKQTKDYRGMLSGRISARRLHRVGYGDQRVFQLRQRPDEIDMSVCLCMDLSGSTGSYRELIEQTVVALTDSMTKEKVDFIAVGYSGNGHNVYVPRMYDKESGRVNLGLDNKTWGSTPSYEGLAAAEAELLKFSGNKKKVLFHFTDGSPNDYNTDNIVNLLKDAKERGITAIHICLSSDGEVNKSFKSYYGQDALAIKDVAELPDLIDRELRKQLKIGE